MDLEKKILERAIKWPNEYVKPDHANFDDDEKDLVDKLCQIEPKDRLGGTKETMPDLKAHPAFKDIDWVAISDPEFKGAVPLMDALVKAENEYNENKANESLIVPKAPMIDVDKSPKMSNFSLGGKNDLRIV